MEKLDSYRNSHTTKNYGLRYSKTYSQGYYFYQWNLFEKNILKKIIDSNYFKNKNVLDFACGTGRITNELVSLKLKKVDGVDISNEMLIIAKDRVENVDFYCEDITTNLNENFINKYDLVTSFRFFTNAEQSLRISALKAINKSLKPTGKFILNIHQNKKSFLGMIYSIRNFIYNKKIANVIDEKTIISLLKENGFKIKSIHYYSVFPRLGYSLDFSKSVLKNIMYFTEIIYDFFRLPKKYKQCFIIEAEKL